MTDKPAFLNYDALKQLSVDLGGRPVSTLIALASRKDPFFIGPRRQADAEWFAQLWKRLNIGDGAHVRRIHYLLVSQKKPVLCPDGTPYENTEKSWKLLSDASKDARYLKLVPDSFVDRRNAEARIYRRENAGRSFVWTDSSGIDDMPEPPKPPEAWLSERVPPQRFQIEIWAEKTTMNDILEPLAQRYAATLVTGAGELSATACRLCVERAVQDKRPVRILYVSDFDPAGQSMPVAVARKAEFLLQGLDLDVQVRPVVLTAQQCEDYALPRTPIKETERRIEAFEQRHGEGATELDALEALHPGVLAQILEREIGRYYDSTLARRTALTAVGVRRTLADFNAEINRRFADDIERAQTEYEEIVAAYQDWRERTEVRWQGIMNILQAEAPDMSKVEWPEPDEGNEDPDPLFDSRRDYVEQIDAYKAFQDKPTVRKVRSDKAKPRKKPRKQTVGKS